MLGTCLSDCFLESRTRFLNKKDGSVKAFGFYKEVVKPNTFFPFLSKSEIVFESVLIEIASKMKK